MARVNIALRVLLATLIPLVVFGLLGTLAPGGLVVAGIVAVAALPVLGTACLISLFAARSIAHAPYWWAIAAVVVAFLAGTLLANVGGGLLSLFISAPAMGLFVLSFAIWPSPFRGAPI